VSPDPKNSSRKGRTLTPSDGRRVSSWAQAESSFWKSAAHRFVTATRDGRLSSADRYRKSISASLVCQKQRRVESETTSIKEDVRKAASLLNILLPSSPALSADTVNGWQHLKAAPKAAPWSDKAWSLVEDMSHAEESGPRTGDAQDDDLMQGTGGDGSDNGMLTEDEDEAFVGEGPGDVETELAITLLTLALDR
jgi:hypothetical protein